jgi:uncharacterized membrane protein AbrB (regulator of aidB expression)
MVGCVEGILTFLQARNFLSHLSQGSAGSFWGSATGLAMAMMAMAERKRMESFIAVKCPKFVV